MSWFTLERNKLKVFNKTNSNLMNCNLDDLNNDFKYFFYTSFLLVHGVDQG